ncbi:MAG: hypothetical protein V1927_05835 [Candidatus Omnitrophota bacterium]
MEGSRKIIIGDKVITREELFEEKEKFRKVQAAMPFEEKIKALVELQKIAYSWGGKKDVIIWI